MKLRIDPEMLKGDYIENLTAEHPDTIGVQFDPLKESIPTNIVHNLEKIRPFGGLKHEKGLSDRYEQLYEDRALFRVIDSCQARCTNCYIKNQIVVPRHIMPTLEEKLVASEEEVERVLKEVKSQPKLRNFLISGGTPFILTAESLDYLIGEFLKISQISQIYIAGSRPIFNPNMFRQEIVEVLTNHVRYDAELKKNKRIGVTVHINHPDELQPEVVEGLNNFSKSGIPLFSQTILMRGVNDSEETLEKLYSNLSGIGVNPYYLLHAMPTRFAASFRTSLKRGLDLMNFLERNSGHERPLFTVATKVGKVHLTNSTNLNYIKEEGKRYVVLKTPYKKEEFLRVTGRNSLPETVFEREASLHVKYLDGDQ